MLPLALAGLLITYRSGHELLRERWSDDGVVVASEVSDGPERVSVTVDRKLRTVTLRHGVTTVTKSLSQGALPLVNGQWAAYALVAERFKDGKPPAPFKLFLPEQDLSIDATAQLRKTASGRRLTVKAGKLEVHVDFDGRGAVVHADVPAEGLVVEPGDPAAVAPPLPPERSPAPPLPATVTEEPVACDNGGAHLRGVVWRPTAHPAALPLVIIIADAGPVDRDGNGERDGTALHGNSERDGSGSAALHGDSYRLLALALAEHGVASLRYDKRGVGASTRPARPATFEDFVSDAAALVTQARASRRYSAVYLAGHGEGALAALSVGARLPLDGIISIAGAGRPLAVVLRAELARRLSAAELAELDRALGELRAGRAIAPLQSSTLRLRLRPELEPFLRQSLLADPLALARSQATPLTIVQGDRDAQVSVDEDARALARARPDGRLVVLPDVDHMLKMEKVKSVGAPSGPDPLAPGVVDAVLSALKK